MLTPSHPLFVCVFLCLCVSLPLALSLAVSVSTPDDVPLSVYGCERRCDVRTPHSTAAVASAASGAHPPLVPPQRHGVGQPRGLGSHDSVGARLRTGGRRRAAAASAASTPGRHPLQLAGAVVGQHVLGPAYVRGRMGAAGSCLFFVFCFVFGVMCVCVSLSLS